MINKNKIVLALAPLMLVVLASYVMASAVSVPYWNGLNASDLNVKPLALNPGQTGNFLATLQSDGTRNESVRVRVLEGFEVVSITDAENTYFVPIGVIDVPVNFKATVPEGAPAGKVYNVRLEFSSSPVAKSGVFQFGSSIIKKFDVVVVEKPKPEVVPPVAPVQPKEEPQTDYLPLVVVLVLIIIVLTVIVIKVAKNKKR